MSQSIPSQKRGLSTMSKKRFYDICELLHQHIEDAEKADAVIKGIQDIMMFDPSIPHYTQEIGKKETERKKKIAQEKGVTTYALFVKPYTTKQNVKQTES